MTEKEFDVKLKELIKEITTLPNNQQKQLTKLTEETKERHKELKINASNVQKSFGDLRICVKYLLFDLEATRRERDQFKSIINKNNNSPGKIEGEI